MNRYQALFGTASLIFAGLSSAACIESELETSDEDLEIRGGTVDYNYKYPWAVDVSVNSGGTLTKCAGVLVAPTWVLSSTACTGTFGTALTVSYTRTNASGTGESDSRVVSARYQAPQNGALILLQISTPLADPLGLLRPAAIPTDPGVAGQVGTVVNRDTGAGTVRVSTPTIQGASSSTFTAGSATSSLCASDRGAGLIISSGGKNVVLGIATGTGACLANGETWTGQQVAPISQWIHDTTGMWGVFDTWANAPGAKAVSGDFDGDGDADIALVGGSGWSSIPVAFSNRDGTFTITNYAVYLVPSVASSAGAKVVAGDVNGDGKDDLVVTGVAGMSTIPVAFSTGTGEFATSNLFTFNIPTWAANANVKVLMGDVDNDADDDLILTGGSGTTLGSSIQVGFSNRDGSFTVTNQEVTAFPGLAQASGAKPAVSDVNGDGKVDIVLVGGSGWTTVPTALSNGNGTFTFSNPSEPSIAQWSPSSTVKLLGGCRRSVAHASRPNAHRCDVNNDGRGDILLTGGAQWSSIPVGYRIPNPTQWYPPLPDLMINTNAAVWAFPTWAQDPNAKVVSGDFNGDRRTDLALVGGSSWWTIPVAYSATNGTFTVSNKLVD